MPQYRVKEGHKLVTTDGEAHAGHVVDLPADVAAQYAAALTPIDQAVATQPPAAAGVEPQA